MDTGKATQAIIRNFNEIVMSSMQHPRDVSNFYWAINEIIEKGFSDIIIDFNNVMTAYPDACVPISAAIQYLIGQSFNIQIVNTNNSFLKRTRIENPLNIDAKKDNDALEDNDILSKVWKFSDGSNVSLLVDCSVLAIKERLECAEGVLQATEWCINEVMDNVLQHAGVECGYYMMQIHPVNQRVAICIADTGIGVLETLRKTKYSPLTSVDALTLSIKEGVTRDPSIGQGNGLWGLTRIVNSVGGRISLTSGDGSIFMRNSESKFFKRLPVLSKNALGTIVDFQLDLSSGIDLARALGGHQPINLTSESLETKDGDILIKIKEKAHGTGTRRAGEQLRNYIINTANNSRHRIIIDFSEIAVISSSFADEFLGKLMAKYGIYGFQRLFHMVGMNDTIQQIAHKSITQRLTESMQVSNNTFSGNS
jgi:anti-anti-sigma regulatory factor